MGIYLILFNLFKYLDKIILTLMLPLSPHLERIVEEFSDRGYKVSISQVEYELQKGGNQMLVISNVVPKM